MRKLATAALLFFSISVHAQQLFGNLNLKEALQRADEQGKLVFLQFESDDCQQCNDVADKGLSDEKLQAMLRENFIVVKSRPGDPDRQQLAATYNMKRGFGSLFINAAGMLVHKYPMSTTFSKEYFNQVDIALQKAGESASITEWEKQYRAGNKSFGVLEQLLLHRRQLNMDTDPLLDEYVAALPRDSALSPTMLQFVASFAPVLQSKADLFLRANREAFNWAWFAMDGPTRVNINNRIIFKSMERAIREKNERSAYHAASFARGTFEQRTVAAEKAFYNNMLRFYEQTNDTVKYITRAREFYDQFYMTVSPDSLRHADSLNRNAVFRAAPKDTVREGGRTRVSAIVPFRPIAQDYMRALNNAAWTYYRMSKSIPHMLTAHKWSQRALEFYKSPEALDTYAKLCYRLGQKTEAVIAMEEAIALRKKQGFPSREYEMVLVKMTSNQVVD